MSEYDFCEFRSRIMNEIESHEFSEVNSQRHRIYTNYKRIQNTENFHKFIISLIKTIPKNLLDIKILSFYLSQIEGIQDIIRYSRDNIHGILHELATQLDYEFYHSNKIIFRKGK